MKPRDKELKSLLRERPDDRAALCELCHFYLERDRQSDAEKWVREAHKRHPTDPEVLMLRAELLLDTGKLEDLAVALDEAATAGVPESVVEGMRGLLAMRLGDRDRAIGHLTRAIELKPDSYDSRLALASALSGQFKWEEVGTHCEELLRIDAKDPDVHALMASSLFHRERFDRATYHAEKALELDPGLEDAAVTRAVIISATQGEKEACTSLAAFVDEFPRSPDAMRLLIALYEDANYLGDAIDLSRRLVRLDPADADAHLRLAHLLQRVGHREEAIEQARRALGADGGFREARVLIASLSIRLKRFDEAVRHLDALDAPEMGGPDAESRTVRGQLLMARSDPAGALTNFRAAVEMDEENAAAWAGEALALSELQRHDEAVERLRKAIELDPHQPIFQLQLADLYRLMGRTEEADAAEAKLKELMGS